MSPSRSLIHPGASEHYEAAEAYESRYAGRTEDIDFYLRRVSRGCDVLEYGAGAGRLTLPLVRKGANVTATDVSRPMLELLRRRAGSLEPLERTLLSIREADMRTFRSSKRFDRIIAAFHTVCHLYSPEDMRRFLQRSMQHLKPGGRLLFDLPLPRIDMPGYDPISQVRVTEMDGPDGPQLLTQRWYQPQEVRMHLHYAGFRHVALGADFSASRIDRETSVFTVVGVKPVNGV